MNIATRSPSVAANLIRGGDSPRGRETVWRPQLEVRELTVYRGEHCAVSNVSFQIACGEFVGILGRSGAGKTTLMHALAGLVQPSGGSVRWDEHHQHHRAVIFQHYRIVPQLSALTNVLCGRLGQYSWWKTLAGFPAADKALARQCLQAVGLPGKCRQPVCRLSGGEQQRVAVARALIQKPTILLADEPVAALDAETANEIMTLLQSINRDRRLTIICVLHDLEMAERFAARVLLLEQGRLVYDGSPKGLQAIVQEKLQWKTLL